MAEMKGAMKYYDLRRNWPKVRPHLDAPRVVSTLVRDFNRFTWGRWRQRFTAGHTPFEFESCDWRCDHRGRRPAYWMYVKHAACHWTVNFALELAQLVEPQRPWRVLKSDKHSTVWDGAETLFDFNFQALGVSPDECFELAALQKTSREFPPGQHTRCYLAAHWKSEIRHEQQ